jgi:proline dehydrogenase
LLKNDEDQPPETNGKLSEAQAVSKGVKLMVDAEHSYFQPAIDHMTLRLMKKYNKEGNAVIYNTYQVRLGHHHDC